MGGRKKDRLIIGGENIYPKDIEEIVGSHPAIHDGRVVAMGGYNPDLGTEDIVVVVEVEREEFLRNSSGIEQVAGSRVVANLGVAAKTIFLKPSQSIATREKLLKEHPELNVESQRTSLPMTAEAQQMIEHLVQLIRKPGVSIDENTAWFPRDWSIRWPSWICGSSSKT